MLIPTCFFIMILLPKGAEACIIGLLLVTGFSHMMGKVSANFYICELMPTSHHHIYMSISCMTDAAPELLLPAYFKFYRGDWKLILAVCATV